MQVQRVVNVFGETLRLGLSLGLVIDRGSPHAFGYHSDLALFPLLPYPMRHVEQDTLEEEHEGHPLIVRVISLLPKVAAKTRVSHVSTHRFRVVAGQRERVRDPAIRVYHVVRYTSVA